MKAHQPIHKIYNINTTTNKIGCLLRVSCSKRARRTLVRALKSIHTFERVLSLSLNPLFFLISCYFISVFLLRYAANVGMRIRWKTERERQIEKEIQSMVDFHECYSAQSNLHSHYEIQRHKYAA